MISTHVYYTGRVCIGEQTPHYAVTSKSLFLQNPAPFQMNFASTEKEARDFCEARLKEYGDANFISTSTISALCRDIEIVEFVIVNEQVFVSTPKPF